MHPLLLANHLIMLAGGFDADYHLTPSERWGVTLVGLGVVIEALAILVVVILLFGKIFDQINKNQKEKQAAAAAKKKPKQAPAKKAPAPVQPKPAAKPAAPAVQAVSDDEEVIAVISAVVAMMSEQDGKTYRIKSVAKSQKNSGFSGRSAWAMDGRRQNVNPF